MSKVHQIWIFGAVKNSFFNKHGIPSVVGCADGTLVNILRPTENEHDCYSIKGRHAVNTMILSISYDIWNILSKIICFRYATTHIKYWQSMQNMEEDHDSFVWANSVDKQ